MVNSATRLCLSILLPSISYAWVPDTRTLSNILLLESCVSKITSSLSTTGVSPVSSSDYLKFMARLQNVFCDSISSFTKYFVAGNAILCGSHGCYEVSSMCGSDARPSCVEDHVLRNILVPYDSKQAMNFPSGLMILVVSAAYGLSCTVFYSDDVDWGQSKRETIWAYTNIHEIQVYTICL